MEPKPGIESKVNETLNSAKGINFVDVPAFFTEKTVNKLRTSIKEENSFSYSGLLKIAAILVLLIINTYTIKYILNPQQESVATSTATVNDLVNDYQPNDMSEVSFEENLNK
jgi:hypothetical protein